MKTNILHRGIAAAALAATLLAPAVKAQTTTGYFLDDYTYRFQMNPAMANERSFVAMPGLGNLNVEMNGNMGVNNFLYYKHPKTVTFMSPEVSVSEALSGLKDHNKTNINTRVNILGVGFKGFGGYNTVTLSAVGGLSLSLPRSVFSLLKEGITNQEYCIDGLNAQGRAYAELQLGHSRKLNDRLRVGANVKILLGLADIDADLTKATLNLGTDSWRITTDANMQVSLANFKYKTKFNETTGTHYVNSGDLDKVGINGFGLGLDLGAVYKLTDDIELSAAVTDLGFISFSENYVATTGGVKTFDTDKYLFNPDDDAANSFDNEWDRMTDELAGLYQLKDMGNQGSRTAGLHTTVNVGGSYTLPTYKAVKFGLLSSTRIAGKYTMSEVRLSANYAPCKVFDMALSGVAGSYGVSWGWLLNLHCPGFNIFVGMDRVSSTYTKQFVPTGGMTGVNFGLNFLF